MPSRIHEVFISAETTSENVLRRAVDEENNNGRQGDVRYRPLRKGSRLGWLLDSPFKISENWLEQLQRATLIEERHQGQNPLQNYEFDARGQEPQAYEQGPRLMPDPLMQDPRMMQDPRLQDTRYEDSCDMPVTYSRYQAYSSAYQEPSIPGYTLSPSSQPVGYEFSVAQPRSHTSNTPPPTTRVVQPSGYPTLSQGPSMMIDPRTNRQVLVPVPSGAQFRSGPDSQPRYPPMRSDSHNARTDMQRRDSKYNRHTADPNSGSITITSGRSGTLPITGRENRRRVSYDHPVENPRIPQTMSLQQEEYPPRSSSLKRHADRESDSSQKHEEKAYQTTLSALALRFATIEVADFMGCGKFVETKPRILAEDSRDFRREALHALRAQNDKHARQCIARAVLLDGCQDKSRRKTADYISRLGSRKGGDYRMFQSECQRVLDDLIGRARQVAGPKPMPAASQALPLIRGLSIAPTGQGTHPVTESKLSRHGQQPPSIQAARSKSRKPTRKSEPDDVDGDSTIRHKFASRHATRVPNDGDDNDDDDNDDDDDDDDDDDGTFGHKMNIRPKGARHEDTLEYHSDEPEHDPYGRHVDRGKRANVEAAAKDAKKRSDQGGRERVPPGASRRPRGSDDDDDDDDDGDDDGTFGHGQIPPRSTYREETKRNDQEAARDNRPINTSKNSGKRIDQKATRDLQQNIVPTNPGPRRGSQVMIDPKIGLQVLVPVAAGYAQERRTRR